jgi:hypothetical protein
MVIEKGDEKQKGPWLGTWLIILAERIANVISSAELNYRAAPGIAISKLTGRG